MKEENKLNAIIAFESNTKTQEKKTFGIWCDAESASKEHYRELIEYWVGAWKWAESGNWVTYDNRWIDRSTPNETYYNEGDAFILDYCKKAYDENPIPYLVIENIQIDMPDKQSGIICSVNFKEWILSLLSEAFWYNPEYDNDIFCTGEPSDEYEEVCDVDSDSDDLPF